MKSRSFLSTRSSCLSWPADEQTLFQTAYVKRMKNEADSVTSFPRWHRLILTPQPNALTQINI